MNIIDLEKLRKLAEDYKQAVARKGIPLCIDTLLDLEEKRRALTNTIGLRRQLRNELTDKIAAGCENKQELILQSREIGATLEDLQKEFRTCNEEFERMVAFVPGLPWEGVPDGMTDAENVEVRRWQQPRTFDFQPRDHLELIELHSMANFTQAREIAGARAYALMGNGVLLEQAVLRMAFDFVIAKGFTPVMPPLMVKTNAMFGTGYFPVGAENAYELERDGLFLTGTSEVGIVALLADQTFETAELPLRFVGMTTCFRREAGSAGRDTRGLYRVHQFQKVEQVIVCENDEQASNEHHLLLLQNAENILQALELPHRVVEVCAGELGLGQTRKHDIETWMPSRNAYGETHSCSSFHDFQTRRLNIRQKDTEGKKLHAFTLNNTAIATPRVLIALMENHQNEDGTINIPRALRPYLGGHALIKPGVALIGAF